MRDHLTEALISAYLDGEVSAAEQAAVEQALAESAEHRQFLDELRRQRDIFSHLPRHRLPDDFFQRVLDEAQRRRANHVVVKAAASEDPAAASRLRRTFAWAAAIAAALTLTVTGTRYLGPGWGPGNGPNGDGGSQVVAGNGEEDPSPQREPAVVTTDPPGAEQLARSAESLVYYVPQSDRQPQIALVMDITLSPEAVAENAFPSVMAQAGIEYDPDLTLDEALGKQVLESRFVAEVAPVGEPDGAEPGHGVEMLYVVCDILRFNQLYLQMAEQRHHFVEGKLDMIITPAELNLFHRLNAASHAKFARQIPPQKRTLAHRLVFNVSLRSGRLLGKFPTPTLQAELVPEQEAAGRFQLPQILFPSAEPETTEAPAAAPQAARDAAPAAAPRQDVPLEQQMTNILFILRSPRAGQ